MKLRALVLWILSLVFFAAAGWLVMSEHQRFQQALTVYPAGSTVAGVPVGGLDQQQAGMRVAQLYSLTPVELRYSGSALHIDPSASGQRLDLAAMLEQAEKARAGTGGWPGFRDFLWNQLPEPFAIPLSCSADLASLRSSIPGLFANRYGQAPTAARPVPGDSLFLPGSPGEWPDLDPAYTKIAAALCSASQRVVEIGATAADPLPPDPALLPLVLEGLVQAHGFDGIIELYYQDLHSGETFSLAMQRGKQVDPGIAFTAASTIKIPVMISAYKRVEGELSPDLRQHMQLMIDLSENSSTDQVMMRALDPTTAPLQVTADMRALGLENTFLAGFFYLGAPLLDRFQTPAAQRSDLSTDPDIYNQTTAADMGRLMVSIQQCADGGGLLIQSFGGAITPQECEAMLELLAANRKGVLVEAGVPDGTRVAHKYGWVIDPRDGLMHAASDAAIVYTPGGNFVLTIYLYHPDQLHWEPAQRLAARLTTAVVNYHNQWR
jgi:beta-lactamase class A